MHAEQAEREEIRANKLRELEHLLLQHPDVARILDLIEETRPF